MIGYILSIVALIVAIWLGVSVGSVKVPISTLWDTGADAIATNIVWKIRMPRVVLAGLVGASLAIAGAAFQGLLKKSACRSLYVRSVVRCLSRCRGYALFRYFGSFFRDIYIACF